MEAKEREKFFTFEKIWWTVVYDLMLIGFFGCFIWFQVQVLGNDLRVAGPSAAIGRSK